MLFLSVFVCVFSGIVCFMYLRGSSSLLTLGSSFFRETTMKEPSMT